MKRIQLAAINKRLVAELPCFSFKGALLFLNPINRLLRGLNLEGSAFDKTSFDAEMFILPLCRPTTYLYYSFGRRIRSRTGVWDAQMSDLDSQLVAAIREEVLPHFDQATSLEALIAMIQKGNRNARTLEALGYAQVRVGAFADAIETFDEIGCRDLDRSIAWQKELADRMAALRDQVVADPARAQADVIAIEAQTVRNLGLDAFWAGPGAVPGS